MLFYNITYRVQHIGKTNNLLSLWNLDENVGLTVTLNIQTN